MKQAEEIVLQTPITRLAGLRWKNEGAPPVLCLHGWLDNAASFLPLAGQLPELDIFALDLPGHGHSEHRYHTARYHFVDYLWDVDAALTALGWESCHLVGHSMGSSVSTVYAAAAPERVRSIVTLDGIGPMTNPVDKTAERLRRGMAAMRRERSPLRSYASIDEMVRSRRAASDLSEAAARLLVERSARHNGKHFEWRTDSAINWVSPIVLTEDQALDCLRNIEAPLLSWLAIPHPKWYSESSVQARKEALKNGRHRTIDGHHHFHMDIPEQIAEPIRSFILQNNQIPNSRENNEHAD